MNDEEGRHQELHVLLTIPRTHRADRAEEEAVVLHAQARGELLHKEMAEMDRVVW